MSNVKGIRAFSDPKYDYYELMQDLGGIIPKGAIFVHDTDDTENGSTSEGCLKLCWTPDGNVYFGDKAGVCGGTVIFHTEFTRSDMFKKVRNRSSYDIKKAMASLEECINILKTCINLDS